MLYYRNKLNWLAVGAFSGSLVAELLARDDWWWPFIGAALLYLAAAFTEASEDGDCEVHGLPRRRVFW